MDFWTLKLRICDVTYMINYIHISLVHSIQSLSTSRSQATSCEPIDRDRVGKKRKYSKFSHEIQFHTIETILDELRVLKHRYHFLRKKNTVS